MEGDGKIGPVRVRPAREGEAGALTELAIRSKAHWGYDEAFMEACREELAVGVEAIAAGEVYVLEETDAGRILGTFSLASLEPEESGCVELCLFFLEPERIGRGLGRFMFQSALDSSKRWGFARLVIQSDPNAEPFYRAMGCERTGATPSASIPGRNLPRLEIELRRVTTR